MLRPDAPRSDIPTYHEGPRQMDGMMLDAAGRYVPRDKVKPEHLLEDELVRELHQEAALLNADLRAFRERSFERIRALLELLDQQYQAKRGGRKGNVTLSSFDGTQRVSLAIGEHLAFGPELQTAKKLVDECITEWSEGADQNLRAIVDDAFQVNKEGKVQVDRILGLRRLNIDHPTWKRAMEAISDGVRVVGSKEYVRLHRRPSANRDFERVSLDIANA